MSLPTTTQERCTHDNVIVTEDGVRCRDCGVAMDLKNENGAWRWMPIDAELQSKKSIPECPNPKCPNTRMRGVYNEGETTWICDTCFAIIQPQQRPAMTPEVAELARKSIPSFHNQNFTDFEINSKGEVELKFEDFIRDPRVTWYGPHECECGCSIVRSSTESGGVKLDAYDPNHHYPNFRWQEHKCPNENPTTPASSQPKIKRP